MLGVGMGIAGDMLARSEISCFCFDIVRAGGDGDCGGETVAEICHQKIQHSNVRREDSFRSQLQKAIKNSLVA